MARKTIKKEPKEAEKSLGKKEGEKSLDKTEKLENKIEEESKSEEESSLGKNSEKTNLSSLGENSEKTEKEDTEKITEKQKNQAKWIFIVMGVLIASVFITYWFVLESKKFDCVGMPWQKEMFGKIPIYTSIISGYGANGMPINFKVALRNNPKELKTPIEGDINYIKGVPVYLALDMNSNIDKCANLGGSLALISFGSFMSGMGFDLVTGITTKNESELYKRPFINCENTMENTVIVLSQGNESKIYQDKENPNCYVLSVKDCEVIEVMEKFEVATISKITGREDC